MRQKRKPELQIIVPTGPNLAKRAHQKPSSSMNQSGTAVDKRNQNNFEESAGPSEEVSLAQNEEGLVEVRIEYEMASKLAMGFGVSEAEVLKVVSEDNEQRGLQKLAMAAEDQAQTESAQPTMEEQEDGDEQSEADAPIYGTEPDRFFDPCSEDELQDDVAGMDQDC